MSNRRVVVVGAGLTGLCAAYRLLQAGMDVTVLERSETVGGLAGGFLMRGHPLEKTYHHIFRTDRDILDLVEELGLSDELEWCDSSMAIFSGGKAHSFSGPRDLLRFRPLPFFSRLRLGAVVAFLQRYRKGTRLAGESASKWMRRWSGKHAHRVIWEPLLRGKFSRFAEEISMAWLWARIHIRANSRDKSAGGEQLGYFNRGFARISDVLAERIRAAGGRIITGARLEALAKTDSGWTVRAEKLDETADHVLFTGSCRAWADVLERSQLGIATAHLAQLRSIRYLGAACLVFSHPVGFVDAYWNNINEPGAPFLVLIRHTRLVPASRYGDREVYYLGNYFADGDAADTDTAEQLRERWFGWLQRLVPAFDPKLAGDLQLFRFRDAQHVVDAGYAERIPAAEGPLPGLWLANFAQIYPEDRGTNYAVREGNRIAQKILQHNR
ncbi:NAD(P)/FAD-dependent oxidoreductase [Nibricoccus sp. IMCC34717]|uniref:NAD(P)/FAD-dependent oxidoreductase n=1 Tax=Nibricoccus sp. IMCC34717 TaxID=3034021 RepID=UPI00384E0839